LLNKTYHKIFSFLKVYTIFHFHSIYNYLLLNSFEIHHGILYCKKGYLSDLTHLAHDVFL